MTASPNSSENSCSSPALSHLSVLVTRAENQADELNTRLNQEGATVYALPLLAFQAPKDCIELDAALQNLSAFHWLIFASKNAVEFTFQRLEKLATADGSGGTSSTAGKPSPFAGAAGKPFPQIAVIGSGTAKALEAHNLKADFIPPAFVAESLVEHLPQSFDLTGKKILWLKTNIGRPLIKTELEKGGATVTAVTVYETNLPANSRAIGEKLLSLLMEEKIDVITVASAQTARNLATILSESLAEQRAPAADSLKSCLEKIQIAAIGPITAKACRENLGKADLVAGEYNLDGLVNLLKTFNKENRETLGINKNEITI